MARMNSSAQRLALPVSLVWCMTLISRRVENYPFKKTFNGAAFLDLIKELVRLERHWIPQENGHSLYIRPVMSAFLGTLHGFLCVHWHPTNISWHTEYHRHFSS